MRYLLFLLLSAMPAVTSADPATVEAVEARPSGTGWSFSVTLRHGDTGWDDYADGWRILAPDGTVLGTRVLAHPHETEQPFTRSLSGVSVPDSLRSVQVQTSTNVESWSGAIFSYDLPE